MHRNVRRVVEAAAAIGVTIEPRAFPEGTKTAADAAAAIGVEVGQIVKSLVFLVDGAPVMALVAGDNRLSERKLAAACGGGVVGRADADAVRAATGFPIGGVPPFGHDLPVLFDEALLGHERVWAAAGDPHSLFCVDPQELARCVRARIVALGE